MFNTFFLNKEANDFDLPLALEECIYPYLVIGKQQGDGKTEAKNIASLLKEFFPQEAFYSENCFFDWISHNDPYVSSKIHYPIRLRHTLFLFCSSSQEFKQEEFFQEMLKRHLIPGKELSIAAFRCMRFYLRERPHKLFLAVEATVILEERKSLELFQSQLPRFTEAITSGCFSPKSAKLTIATTFQTFKQPVLTHDQKIFRIQKDLNRLVKRFPHLFETDLLHEWGCFLSLSTPLFSELRPALHLSRLVASQFLMKKMIKRMLLTNPEKRHLAFRFIPSQLQSPFGKKSVLGLLVSLSLFDKYEHFDEEHVLLAVQKWVPNACLVQGSRYLYRNPQEERFLALYVELDKTGGEPFSLAERKQLTKILPQELKERVQKLMPLLFTVRNEEQVMKNIIVLSQELKDSSSLPQMMISFEKQTENSLIFTLILVYVADQKSIEERLYSFDSLIEVSLERKDIIGYLENGLPKEASVFRLQIAKTVDMLRRDFSVNLHLARQKAYSAICQAIGDVRDYDGGLILKQHELFSQLQAQFPHVAKEKSELLENFFYSITPIEKQATLSLKILETLFTLVLSSLHENLSKKGSYYFKHHEDSSRLFVFIRAESSSLKKHIRKLSSIYSLPAKSVVSSTFFLHETMCVSYIVESSDPERKQEFLNLLQVALSEWQQERKKFQVLRLNFVDCPISLDPRLGGDDASKWILNMLFEGLTRIGANGKAECAVADSVELSKDLKTYTFHLRKCCWSNGDPVLASDFEYAWKKILSPYFKTPFAFIFYPIKNAQAAKEGKISVEQVGIHSLNEKVLLVELEHPVPYFLELVAQPIFSPINKETDQANPHWATGDGETFVCNGAFHLKNNRQQDSYLIEKNPCYWDVQNMHLNQVIITKANARSVLEMFKNDELDWVGRPMRPWESLFELAKTEKTTEVLLEGRMCWCSLNVKRFPLNNLKLRQAFSLAINREELVDMLREGKPTHSPLAPHLAHEDALFSAKIENRQEMAQALFKEALHELNLSEDKFPSLHLIYPEVEKREKTAKLIQNQWKKVLGIDVIIQSFSWQVIFRKVTEGDYEMAEIMWNSWINDPMYTLNVFKSSEEYLNFPKWEHEEYKKCLELAAFETDLHNRRKYLSEAESILISERPIIPLFFENDRGLKKNSLKIEQKFGSLDFKRALIVE